MSRNGVTVAQFEREFAAYVGARYGVALCNGTATLHTALVALGVKPGDRVAVPPLTMSSTTMAVLQASAVPVFCDVDERTWVMPLSATVEKALRRCVPVDLYGLHNKAFDGLGDVVVDAAQTLRPHGGASFTSYSFQASKILSTGEGGMLVTDDEELATKAREFSSLGYRMRADQPRIDPSTLKSPTFDRHHTFPAFNYRMADVVAAEGLRQLEPSKGAGPRRPMIDDIKGRRLLAAQHYTAAIDPCPPWLTRQHIPSGWQHDFWTYAVACDTPDRALWLSDAIVKHGGERPYGAWKLTYQEPAFRHLAPKIEFTASGQIERNPIMGMGYEYNGCPVAESLQPRLLQMATNNLTSAEQNANALRKAIAEAT